jgi:hypothetical protein
MEPGKKIDNSEEVKISEKLGKAKKFSKLTPYIIVFVLVAVLIILLFSYS